MASINSVAVGLSGSTGTGKFVGDTSPTLVTPILGAATATSVAFSPTTSGIIGTTAADNASAGKVGEVISSNIAYASAISITNATPKNLTSISLTAGDWDVWGNIGFLPAATTTVSLIYGGISTTSATFPDTSLVSLLQLAFATGAAQVLPVVRQRINVNATTTVYLVGQAGFAVSTMTFFGGIYARRAR